MLTPYRTPPDPKRDDDDHEMTAAGSLVLVVLVIGLLIMQYAPRNRSADPEPRGHATLHCSGHGHGAGRR